MGIFPEEQVARASRLSDLFSRDDTAEIRYLMNRARRTGVAGTQIEYKAERRVLHLALTVAALDAQRSSGFVLVVEDTSDLLRAQKAAAWHEVARRVAHEIKNPLTPIALCADRIGRQLDRHPSSPDAARILRECSTTIAREVESVKTLVDEFSQFSRFPAAQPVPSDLNEIVESALVVFAGRLDGIDLHKDLTAALPLVNVDPEQFRRAVVNLVDNAAEAMQDSQPEAALYRDPRDRCRFRGADRRRHRLRHLARGQGEAVFAVFFDQRPRHRTRPGDCQSYPLGPRCLDPGRR